MRGGARLLSISCLAAAGCASEEEGLQVRAISNPLTAAAKAGNSTLAIARGQLALGNVGLALEAFRKARREQPTSPEPLAGMAACYAAMGRYDLERLNYEAALAFAPRDSALLRALATSLERQGLRSEAARIKLEIAEMAAASAALNTAPATELATGIVAPASSITVKLPPARPADSERAATAKASPTVPLTTADALASAPKARVTLPAAAPARTIKSQRAADSLASASTVTAALAPAEPTAVVPIPSATMLMSAAGVPVALRTAQPLAAVSSTGAAEAFLSRSTVNVDARPAELSSIEPRPSALPQMPSSSATITLPPPRPVAALAPLDAAEALVARTSAVLTEVTAEPSAAPRPTAEAVLASSSVTVALPPARPVKNMKARPLPKAAPINLAEPSGPRLERLSLGEVALVTRDKPLWPVPRSPVQLSTAVRWMPLRSGSARPNIILLNAARRQGLAARTKGVLLDRGWRKIEVADAREIRDSSVVYYPITRRRLGRSLAAQFGFTTVKPYDGNVLLVVLGRDAKVAKAAQLGG